MCPIAFLIACPYSILDFPWFYKNFILNICLAQSSDFFGRPGPGWILYITYFLPYAIGWPLIIIGLLGWCLFAIECVFQYIKNHSLDRFHCLKLILTMGSLILYLVITKPKFQLVWHTLPVIPFIAFFAAVFCKKFIFSKNFFRWVGLSVMLFTFMHTIIYSLAYLRLFWGLNVREEASEWIEKNIPLKKSIGIARSYYWTSGILRQYQPPYRLLKGGDDQSRLDIAMLGLDSVAKEADYCS